MKPIPAFSRVASLPLLLLLLVFPARADYHIAAKIQVGGEGGWDYLEPDVAARRLYVAHQNNVVVVDMDSLKVVGNVPNCPGMGGVAIAHELNRGYTANGAEDTVTVFALDTLKEIGRWKVTGKRPNQIIYEPATQQVFTFNSTGRNVTALDGRTGAVLGTIEVDGRTEFPAFDGKGMIYDSLQDKATVVAIDARTLKVTATYPLAPHTQPAGTVKTGHERSCSKYSPTKPWSRVRDCRPRPLRSRNCGAENTGRARGTRFSRSASRFFIGWKNAAAGFGGCATG